MTDAALNSQPLTGNGLQNLPLSQLHEWPDNPRRTHDAAKHAELVESVRSQGLLQPLLVRPRGNGWEVIAGNRRRRALVDLGDADIVVPCLVRDLDDDSALAAAIKENGDRDGLLPMEEAETYERLLQTRTVEDVAALVGKSTTHVRQRSKLLRLIPIARDLLSSGHLSASAALQLAQLESSVDQADALLRLDFEIYDLDNDTVTDAKQLAQLTTAELSKIDRFGGAVPTAADVRDAVKSLGRVLARAPFPILDGGLVPGVPPCNACPSRTGAQASLFGASDDDACLDAACWKQKTARVDAQLLDRAQREGRLLTVDRTSKLWTKWGGLALDAPFVALDENVDWRGGTWADRLTDEERKAVRVAVDDNGRARELLPIAIADAVRARAMPVYEGDDHGEVAADDREAGERRAADEKKRAEERAKRDAAALKRAQLEKKATDLIVEKFAASPAPDSVALAIAVATTVRHYLPDLLGFDRKTLGAKPMAAAIKELVRRFDADRAGACAWVMRTLLERNYLDDGEQDAVFDALLMIVADTNLALLRADAAPKPKKRGKSAAAHRVEPGDEPIGDDGDERPVTPKKRSRKQAAVV
jgi:ParB/RepB/Spo0J family partition protein